MKSDRAFVHLHVHTGYSLLDGLCRIPELFDAVRQSGMNAVAITDHDALYGVYEFSDAARRAGVKPLFGCELGVRPGDGEPFPVVLLAESLEGFENLQRLITLAHRPGEEPAFGFEDLAAHRAGLLALTGSWPRSRIPRLCGEGQLGDAASLAGALAEALPGGACYLELQNHGLAEQERANAGLRELGRKLGLPTVATNNAHYLRPDDADAHLLLQCVQAGVRWGDRHRVRFPTRRMHLRSPDEMAEAFPDDPQALARTAELAARCRCELPEARPFTFPRVPVPAEFRPDGVGLRPDAAYLAHMARAGLRRRTGGREPGPAVRERLERELDAIERAGYARTLLVLGDLARFARDRGIPVGPGRGALPSSLAAFALGITGIDPLDAGLIFERWLNPAFPHPPDLGLEIAPDRRADCLRYLRDRYGEDRVAHLLTFSTLGPRQALRDAGRVFGIDSARIDDWARRAPESPESLADAIRRTPAFRSALSDDSLGPALRLAARIEGVPRNAGTHPTGIVLSGCPLAERAPVVRGADGECHVQIDQRALTRTGLLKVDLAGTRALQAIAAAAQLAGAGDPDNLPLDDPAAYERIRAGDTLGLDQADTPEMRDFLGQYRPADLGDLAAALALHRPNPPAPPGEMLLRRADARKARPPDPIFAQILSESGGCFLYEEQVVAAAAGPAGLSPEAADGFFRAAAARSSETGRWSRAAAEGFRRTKRVRAPRANRLVEALLAAAPRVCSKASMLASATLLARAAGLKARAPREYLAARIAAEPGPSRRLAAFLAEARRLGLALLPPDVNRSGVRFQPESGALRFGLGAILQIGEESAHAMVSERERGGPYADFAEFCRRQDPRRFTHRVLDALIRSGTLDPLGLPRAKMAAEGAAALSGAAALRRDRDAGQRLLFAPDELAESRAAATADLPEWPEEKKRRDEWELLGCNPFAPGQPDCPPPGGMA